MLFFQWNVLIKSRGNEEIQKSQKIMKVNTYKYIIML